MSARKSRRITIDTERLINLVEKNPALYDKRSREYRDVDIINNVWTSIAQALGVTSQDARTRWRSIKDTYKRKKRELKDSKKSGSGTADIKEPKWQWFKILSFLDEYIEEDSTYSNMPSEEEEDDDSLDVDPEGSASVDSSTCEDERSCSQTPKEARQCKQGQSLSPAPGGLSRSVPSVSNKGKQLKRKLDESSKLLAVLEDTKERNKERQEQRDKLMASLLNKERDSEELFLLSYAPQLKQFPDATRSFVKLKIAQVFHEAQFGSSNQQFSYNPQGEHVGYTEHTMWNL